ncbi:MAG TPA: DUF420 domain-containing protein [candidate division Zixibacteria bacterium]|nr:DUF420 domain-containing protein [candidate division Zixibacteria bacterium]
MQAIHYLPTVNAVLNGTSAVLLLVSHSYIRRGEVQAHKRTMLAALTTSALFLTSYLYYHAHIGSYRFRGPAPWRAVYLTILGSHTVLAVVIVPLIFIALVRAFKGRFAQHRAVARWTYPMWLYVSVTGVIVYLMLYVIFG